MTGEKKRDKAAKVAETARTLWAPAVNTHGGSRAVGFHRSGRSVGCGEFDTKAPAWRAEGVVSCLLDIQIRNFKRLEDVSFELGKSVVLIGPNNSGKTTALQALALWDIGLRRWNEKRGSKVSPEERPGVTINRREPDRDSDP